MPSGKYSPPVAQTPPTSVPCLLPARSIRLRPANRIFLKYSASHSTQSEIFLERSEVAVVVQQGEIVLDAEGGNQAIYGGAYGDALLAQAAIVAGSQNRQWLVTQYWARQTGDGFNDGFGLPFRTHALQDFLKNEVGDGDFFFAALQQIAQEPGVRSVVAAKQCDPDTGIHKNHLIFDSRIFLWS